MAYMPNGVADEHLFDCIGEGWHTLVDSFKFAVDWDTKHNNMPPVVITQVKEKFGELRIYYNGGDSRTDAYATFASLVSQRMCEDCGSPAKTRDQGGRYFRTVCEDHM